jgi:guanosine-3',5'-bis(diphosphate) 3'-pyrophosphohydrolase
VAAHWKYKEERRRGGRRVQLARRDGLAAPPAGLAARDADPGEFLDSLRFEIGGGEVFVFTPKGAVVSLPAGSTPVDFAYAVHTEVGHHTIGGRVNGRLVSLDSVLENGDTVEILTSKADGAGPSRDWLTFVKSPRARNKIRQWFTKERREEAIEQGKERSPSTCASKVTPCTG